MAVVISNHRDPELVTDPGGHLEANLATVAQPAGTFEGRNSDVILEPLTEPQGALDAVWNEAAAELVGAVRGQDRGVTILLGPRSYNNAHHRNRAPGRPRRPPEEPAVEAAFGSSLVSQEVALKCCT
jgi:hypothetical protein